MFQADANEEAEMIIRAIMQVRWTFRFLDKMLKYWPLCVAGWGGQVCLLQNGRWPWGSCKKNEKEKSQESQRESIWINCMNIIKST